MATAGLVVAVMGVAGAGPVLTGLRAVPAAGLWGRAVQVPGLAALAAGNAAAVASVSCPSAGNCAVAGNYLDRAGRSQGFVASERHGRWGKAIAIPGLRALDGDRPVIFVSLSCASAGNCAVSGGYENRSGNVQGFVASERNGRWGMAMEVPGLAALNAGGIAAVVSVSCASPGNCAATGLYADSSDRGQGFVADERNGTWRRAIEIPGLQALNDGGGATGISVSCASAGNCTVGGQYVDAGGNPEGFVAGERNGRWDKATDVPGLAALSIGDAGVNSVSCASAGNCAAGGFYHDRSDRQQGFVASERNGRWSRAIAVPGLRTLNQGLLAEVNSVSCPSAGNCAAAGYYRRGPRDQRGFVASERNGRWGKAIEVPGLRALNAGGKANVLAVSCASAGNCAAAGFYRDRFGHERGFVASQQLGTWDKAIEVPGLAALNTGGVAQVLAVSCAPAGGCTAGGFYGDRSGHGHGFVVSQRQRGHG
jgi:hypothetical protein